MRICVYCSSSEVDPKYVSITRELGKRIGERGDTVVYGGGVCGLMGELHRSAKEAGGDVIGVYPSYFSQLAPPDMDEVLVVEGLRDRKQQMFELADVFVVLPGGLGTLDEFFDIIAPKSLQKHNKAVVLVNVDGLYDGLVEFLQRLVTENFMRAKHMKLFEVVSGIDEVFKYLDAYIPPFEDDLWPQPTT